MFHVTSSTSATPFLLRIHREGQNQFFTDIVNFSIFSERGLGPKLFGFFEEGRMEEFLPSRTLNPNDVLKPEWVVGKIDLCLSVDFRISYEIGKSFPRYHSIEIPTSKTHQCFKRMRESLREYQFVHLYENSFENLYFRELGGGDYQLFSTNVSYSDHPDIISVDRLIEEIDQIEKWAIELFEDTVVFCHNDLACTNILQLNSTNEIMFIDWEYATYNFRGYDLAMHLSETAVLRITSPSGIQINEQLTDDHSNLRLFSEAYVDSDNKIKNKNSSNRNTEIEKLIEEIQFFWPITHLFWACLIMKLGRMECNYGLNMNIQARDRLAVYFHLKSRTENIYKDLSQEMKK
uniref:APH domain-containing protein n=1 Tax=Caenorhabditis tropicalis TaxID=1561998 RepID=A0A1I7V395_9PELO